VGVAAVQVDPDDPDDDRLDDRRRLVPDDLGQCLLRAGPREPAGRPEFIWVGAVTLPRSSAGILLKAS
jgi:hypothetical protein